MARHADAMTPSRTSQRVARGRKRRGRRRRRRGRRRRHRGARPRTTLNFGALANRAPALRPARADPQPRRTSGDLRGRRRVPCASPCGARGGAVADAAATARPHRGGHHLRGGGHRPFGDAWELEDDDVGAGRALRRMCVRLWAREPCTAVLVRRDALPYGTEYYRTKFDARLSNPFVGERAWVIVSDGAPSTVALLARAATGRGDELDRISGKLAWAGWGLMLAEPTRGRRPGMAPESCDGDRAPRRRAPAHASQARRPHAGERATARLLLDLSPPGGHRQMEPGRPRSPDARPQARSDRPSTTSRGRHGD